MSNVIRVKSVSHRGRSKIGEQYCINDTIFCTEVYYETISYNKISSLDFVKYTIPIDYTGRVFKDDIYNLYYVGLSNSNDVYSLDKLEVFDDASLAVNEVAKHF